MTKERDLTYDLLRVMACAMVVLMHSSLPVMGAPGPFLECECTNCTWGGARSTLTELSNISFGIYLMHILLMHELLWQLECVRGIHSYVVQTLVIFVLTFAVSALCAALLSRLPLLWWLVGYRKKTST